MRTRSPAKRCTASAPSSAAGPPPAMRRCMARTYAGARSAPSGRCPRRGAGFPQVEPVIAPDAGTQSPHETGAMPLNALIVGGGPAALEAALALDRLAGDAVST